MLVDMDLCEESHVLFAEGQEWLKNIFSSNKIDIKEWDILAALDSSKHREVLSTRVADS